LTFGTGDANWLPRLPMVRSAVRAMDVLAALLGSDAGGNTAINKFVVAGGSKRGWTTWLTAAVDTRVVAIVPIVIDVLNVRACTINHYASYGFWAPAVGDYTRHKIHGRMETPGYAELLKIVDPYSYRGPTSNAKHSDALRRQRRIEFLREHAAARRPVIFRRSRNSSPPWCVIRIAPTAAQRSNRSPITSSSSGQGYAKIMSKSSGA
jgi:hypothetical protein